MGEIPDPGEVLRGDDVFVGRRGLTEEGPYGACHQTATGTDTQLEAVTDRDDPATTGFTQLTESSMPNNANAFAVVTDAVSSCDQPRRSAMASPTTDTNAGRFFLPRWGTGAR